MGENRVYHIAEMVLKRVHYANVYAMSEQNILK